MFQCFRMFQIQWNIFKNNAYLDVSTNIAVWFKHCLNQKPIPTCLNVSDVSNIYSFCETCFEKLFIPYQRERVCMGLGKQDYTNDRRN